MPRKPKIKSLREQFVEMQNESWRWRERATRASNATIAQEYTERAEAANKVRDKLSKALVKERDLREVQAKSTGTRYFQNKIKKLEFDLRRAVSRVEHEQLERQKTFATVNWRVKQRRETDRLARLEKTPKEDLVEYHPEILQRHDEKIPTADVERLAPNYMEWSEESHDKWIQDYLDRKSSIKSEDLDEAVREGLTQEEQHDIAVKTDLKNQDELNQATKARERLGITEFDIAKGVDAGISIEKFGEETLAETPEFEEKVRRMPTEVYSFLDREISQNEAIALAKIENPMEFLSTLNRMKEDPFYNISNDTEPEEYVF